VKWLVSILLGTAESVAALAWLSDGYPPARDWRDMIGYPLGSPWLTLGLLWVLYSASLVLVFCLSWAWRKAFRRGKSPSARRRDRPPMPGR
jgi:hypothetical protein